MFRFDIKTFERETVRLSVKNRQNIGGERRTRKKSRNDKNEERTDYEGKVGFTNSYTKAEVPHKISSLQENNMYRIVNESPV